MRTRTFVLALALCGWASHAYSQNSKNIDLGQEDWQSCFPPEQYISQSGDPPFGLHVQTTEQRKTKQYLLGILYCEDGTFESSSSPQGIVSLRETAFRTGRWWWEGTKPCTQLDPIDTDTEMPAIECKEAGHWLGDQKMLPPRSVLTARSPATPSRKRHSRSISG